MELLPKVLYLFGFGFLVANVRLLLQFIRFLRIRSSALLTWPGRRPPFYGLLLVLGAVLALLIIYKLDGAAAAADAGVRRSDDAALLRLPAAA